MRVLLSDTSVLLNLLAGDCLTEVSSGLRVQFVICPVVRAETQRLRDPSTGEMVPVMLDSWIEQGVLQVWELGTEIEEARYLAEASIVDDGEAMSIALAVERGVDLAIDDRRAMNHVRKDFPSTVIWTTPDLLATWVERCPEANARIAEVLRLIVSRARYAPASTHPRFAWWVAQTKT